ncbi:MAG TPA: hypothetical protein VFC19_46710 [Candidatus Limnocylindrales bacterium]|nr:hypothetical protein [Candidatus Limnocylindrales bacterium]
MSTFLAACAAVAILVEAGKLTLSFMALRGERMLSQQGVGATFGPHRCCKTDHGWCQGQGEPELILTPEDAGAAATSVT